MTSRVHPAIPFHLTLVLAEPGEESKRKPPVKAPGGTCIEPPRTSCGLPHWLSFGTAGREGNCIPATLSKALVRPRLVYPLASLDVSGQWPVVHADASPNEVSNCLCLIPLLYRGRQGLGFRNSIQDIHRFLWPINPLMAASAGRDGSASTARPTFCYHDNMIGL